MIHTPDIALLSTKIDVAFGFHNFFHPLHECAIREELPTIVGEWSLSLPEKAMHGLSPLQITSVKRAYADTQLLNYEGTCGWFFWSYKLQHASEWNFQIGRAHV